MIFLILTEHDRPRAVVGIKECHLDCIARMELDLAWCVEREWFLVDDGSTFPTSLRWPGYDLPVSYHSALYQDACRSPEALGDP